MIRAGRLLRWVVCTAIGGVVLALAPASPAAAITGAVAVHLFSGEGFDAIDDFNDVSTDDGATWTDAVIVAAQSAHATIPGTQWISSDADSGVTRENTTTLFRRLFSLRPGLTGSTGQICVHADNAVTVKFNDTTVLTQAGTDAANFSGTPECGDLAGLARTGGNSFEFAVANADGPLGLDFDVNLDYTQDPNTPPALLLPDDVTLPATSPAGRTVTYNDVQWIDISGAGFFADCTPASGSLFSVGTTTVTCTATSPTNNQTSTGSFHVTVTPLPRTNTPPVLSLPADMRVDGHSPNGQVVSYTATATDDGAAPPTVVCDPPSGSTFLNGSTSVNCTATDDEGAVTSGAFSVTVIGPLQRACDGLRAVPGITVRTTMGRTLWQAAIALGEAGDRGFATNIRHLGMKVYAATGRTLSPALRRTVLDRVRPVSARLCGT